MNATSSGSTPFDETIVKELAFSGKHVEAIWWQRVRNYRLNSRAIVVNVSSSPASIANVVVTSKQETVVQEAWLLPWQSTVLQGAVIVAAESLIVMRLLELRNLGDIVSEPGWQQYGSSLSSASDFPRNTPLWISPKHELGMVMVAAAQMAGQPLPQGAASGHGATPMSLSLQVNLWYAPPNTDCSIHTLHPFLEVHTQVHGQGRMQKFRERDDRTLYEEVLMLPGLTHAPFFVLQDNGRPLYPWHRYYADTDCIWMAIELHFIDEPADAT
jgi:hypothetical protein